LEGYFESDMQTECNNISELDNVKLQEAWKIYQRLRRIEFGVKYSDDPYFNWGSFMYRKAYHPYLFMREALIRNIPIPENLMKAIDDRYFREHKKKFFESASSHVESELKQKTGRALEYDNIGKALMAILLSKKSGLFVSGNNVNASQIKKSVLGLAKDYGITEYGLGLLDRDITAGLEQLKNNYHLFIDNNKS
jgi:hypothetical protein